MNFVCLLETGGNTFPVKIKRQFNIRKNHQSGICFKWREIGPEELKTREFVLTNITLFYNMTLHSLLLGVNLIRLFIRRPGDAKKDDFTSGEGEAYATSRNA
jgi:hypothetical protein